MRRYVVDQRVGNIFDIDNYTDAVVGAANAVADVATSVVDAISDAGKTIGAVLKFIAPIVALWPGIGTGISVALSAAAAYASGDTISDAVIDTVSSAIPGGPPRVIFDAGATISKAAIRGENVKEATFGAMRDTARAVGGEQAAAAFDAGLAVARGANGRDAIFQLTRKTAQQWGVAPLAAFDAAVAVSNGGDAEDALYAAARDYIGVAGGPVAQGIFDAGVAIRRGKDLQDAGFVFLQDFVAGNTAGERALAFADKVATAVREKKSVAQVVEEELIADVSLLRMTKADVAQELGPLLARWTPDLSEWGSYALAVYEGLPEPLVRAAQAIMRDLEHPDGQLADKLMKTGVESALEKYGVGVVASTSTNPTYAQAKADIRQDELTLAARMPAATLSYSTAVQQLAQSQAFLRVAQPLALAPAVSPVVAVSADTAAALAVKAPAPDAPPRSGTASDVALGLTIASALVALAWWSTSR